jgi:glutamate--cysteine ligase
MAAAEPVLTLDDARRIVADHGFEPASPTASRPTLGIEIEWHPIDVERPGEAVPFDRIEAAARAAVLPGDSRLTFEPGGQVELSSRPLPDFEAGVAVQRDAQTLTTALGRDGIALVALGLLPGAVRPRALHLPRYDAMEAHFDTLGTAGRTMMRQTAALQVNVDLGADGQRPDRWTTAHALGPLLAAVFANSPFVDRAPSDWCSSRLATWLAIERGRTAPVGAEGTARAAWAEYALRAPLMFIRASDADYVPVLTPLTFGNWITDGHELGWPTEDDLSYHLTTLFPPIRPRGWLELRMIDTLPAHWAVVPAYLALALLEDTEAARRIAASLVPLSGRWEDAARDGVHRPEFAHAARECFAAALDALPRLDAPSGVIDLVEAYRDRYVNRDRCPADDLVDVWRVTGRLLPDPEGRLAPIL